MTRFDKVIPRVVPARSAAPLKVGGAELGRLEKQEGGWTWCGQRLVEIEALVDYRRGGDFDTPLDNYLRGALWPLLWISDRPRCPAHRSSVRAWVIEHVGSLSDRGPEWFDSLVAESRRWEPRDPYRRADSIARLLSVSWEERLTLGLKTIGAVDMDRKARAIERKRANATLQRTKREKAGAAPRERSLSATRPWASEGISRRTWERRRSAYDANASASSATSNDAISSATIEHDANASALDDVVVSDTPRVCVTSDDPDECRAKQGRRQAETDLGSTSTQPGGTPEKERSDLAGAARAARPAGEAARAASAPQSPLTPPLDVVDELDVPLAPTSGPNVPPKLRRVLEAWTIGPMPEIARQAFVETKRRLGLKQPDAAEAIGIDVRDLAGADKPGMRLRPAAIARVRDWLLGQDHPDEVDQFAGLRSRKASAPDEQLQLRLLRLVEKPSASQAPPAPTIYGLVAGRQRGFAYVELNGRTVGMVGSDGRVWMASYRGQSVGEHRTKRDAVAEVRRRAAMAVAEVG